MLSKLTLIGMNNFTNGAIWDDIVLPEGFEKDILVNEILKAGGEFCVIYPDAEFLKMQITMFFKKWFHNFDRWMKANNFEYEALYNVDVHTDFSEHGVNDKNSASEGAAANQFTRAASGGSSSNSNNNHNKAAYDASTLQPETSDSGNTSLSTSESASESNSSNNSESMTESGEYYTTKEEYKRGNQGVTMSQEMLLAEFNAWRFNIYSQVADIFVSEFCVCIYV